MAIVHLAILFGIGAFSGSINAVVGGGTFFSFPVLLALGLPPVAANATNTVALWPASATAAGAYRAELRLVRDRLLFRSLAAVMGGIIGALLLLASGDALFYRLVPFLLAGATLLFAFSRFVVQRLSHLSRRANAALTLGLALLFSIYGGYFGAGVGILLMAALALGGEQDPQVANAQKNLFGALINGAAIVIFVLRGTVVWNVALTVMVGAICGGYFGARAARLIPATWLRICVIVVGSVLSVIYFRDAYGG